MYEAEMQTSFPKLPVELESSTVILPISLGTKSDQNTIEKFSANLKSLESVKKIVIVPADLLQIDTLRAEFPNKTEKELIAQAFELCVNWLKEVALLIMKLNINFEILPWHQIMYENFEGQKVHELFYKPNGLNEEQSLKKTRENIDGWAIKTQKILLDEKLIENSQYSEYQKKILKLKEEDKIFESTLSTASSRMQQKFKGDKEALKVLCENYVLKASGVYWMWNDSGLYNYSAYGSDLNSAMRYSQEKIFEKKNLHHIKFKYIQQAFKPQRKSKSAPTTLEREEEKKDQSISRSLPNSPKVSDFVAEVVKGIKKGEEDPENRQEYFKIFLDQLLVSRFTFWRESKVETPIPSYEKKFYYNSAIASLVYGIGQIPNEEIRNELFEKLLNKVFSCDTENQEKKDIRSSMENN